MKKNKRIKIKDTQLQILEKDEYDNKPALLSNTRPIINIFNFPKERLQKRYQTRYKHNVKHLMLDIILAGVAGMFLTLTIVLYLFFGIGFKDNTSVEIDLGDQTFSSGKNFEFYLKFVNENKEVLENAVLSLKMPKGMEILAAGGSMLAADGNFADGVFKLGTVPAGAGGQIKVSSRIFADVDSVEPLAATLSYERAALANIKRNLNTIDYKELNITSSVLAVQIDTPAMVVAKEVLPLSFTVTNNGPQELEGVLVKIEDPSLNLKIRDYGQFYNDKLQGWVLAKLAPGQTETVVLQAQTQATGAEKLSLKMSAYFSYKNHSLKQVSQTRDIVLKTPYFFASLKLLQADNLTPGQKAFFALVYKNNETKDVYDASIAVTVPQGIFIMDSLPNNANYENNQLIFDKTLNPELTIVPVGKEGQLNFTLTVSDHINYKIIVGSRTNYVAQMPLQLNYVLSTQNNTLRVNLAPAVFKVNTDLTLTAYARYFTEEGEQLGLGPLPPVVGEDTNYWIFWRLDNTANEVKNIKITATVPDNVKITGKYSQVEGESPLMYDSVTKKVSWALSSLENYVGDLTPALGIGFEVKITPIPTQARGFADLLTDIKLEATDAFTGELLIKQVKNINTDLLFDSKGLKKGGKVIE